MAAGCFGGRTIVWQIQEALLLEEALDIDAATLLLDEAALCDDAPNQRRRRHIEGWIPHLTTRAPPQ